MVSSNGTTAALALLPSSRPAWVVPRAIAEANPINPSPRNFLRSMPSIVLFHSPIIAKEKS